MTNPYLLYDDQAVLGSLSAGSWEATLPLTNMQTEDISERARSTDATLASTKFVLTLPFVEIGYKAIIVGPTNMTTAAKYRIKAFNDTGLTDEVYDSGWQQEFTRAVFGTLPWGHPNLWTGFADPDDSERGIWIIHVIDADTYPSGIQERVWQVEIDDTGNPDGYVEIGRAFWGKPYVFPINIAADNNNFRFESNTATVKALSGAKSHRTRQNPRMLQFGLNPLTEAQLWGDAYQVMRDAGFGGQVFIVLDPDETNRVTKGRQSFLGTFSEMDGITRAAAGLGSVGYQIEEQV